MNRLPHALVATLMLPIAAALATPSPAAAQASDDSPELAYRKDVMNSLQNQTGALRAVVTGDVTYDGHAQARANAIRDLAMMLTDIFPEGSGGEGSRALPAVWENAQEFAQRVEAIQDAAGALAEVAAGGDMEAIGEALGAVQQTCRGCHTDFRARGGRGRGG